MTHEEKRSKRIADCVEVEMRFNGDSFLGYQKYNSDFNVHHTELLCSTDEEWDKIITSLREELVRRKALAEPIKDKTARKTHIVIDEIYHEDEGNQAFAGTLQECNDFVSEQGFGYKVVPMTEEELKIHNQ
jgi:hypothetical protein